MSYSHEYLAEASARLRLPPWDCNPIGVNAVTHAYILSNKP
jgi:hypothetical protein